MSNTVLHLLKHKIDDGKDLRYLNVCLPNESEIITPLFFGTDLLNNSGISPSNHCRIHTRYANNGFATKIMFPPDVTIGGLTHCQNGAWFYSIQGVFQIVFEHHSRNFQLKIVTSLINTWQGVEADPKLPKKLSVSLQELQTSILPLEEMAKMKRKQATERSTVIETSAVIDSTSDHEKLVETNTKDNANVNETEFQLFTSELIDRVENYINCYSSVDNNLASTILSFLKLIYRESKVNIGQIFSSFLRTVTDYANLVSNSELQASSSSEPDCWNMDDTQNLLLCLIGEWLGKNLNDFKESISKKAHHFKVENVQCIDDIPPAHCLVSSLFPDCMRILVGYWIGLYGSPPKLPPQDSQASKKLSDRQDHSYYSNIQTVKNPGGKREDHSYSTSTPTLITTTTTWLETTPVSPPQQVTGAPVTTRDDHTYVHYENTDPDPVVDTLKTRKDHTYVSTKEPKATKNVSHLPSTSPQPHSCAVQQHSNNLVSVNEDVDGPPVPKKPKLTSNNSKFTPDSPHIIDPTKHSFVLIILEFLNNVLISGIGHVVYTRLIHSD
ncbi:hypothetical protein CHUAL_004497 [Chamberlinius hualienensis]